MTSHDAPHPVHHPEAGHHEAGHHEARHHHDPGSFAEYLDRGARQSAALTARTLDRAASALAAPVRSALDLGSGTGAGTVALARRFPEAQVHALDVSTQLLDRLKDAALVAGVADRVHTHPVDLDDDWTTLVPGGVDLVWASLSLHHVADPASVLQRALSVLRPGGVLVITEMSGSIQLTPDDLGTGRDGLAARAASGVAAEGYPAMADWTVPLTDAGFVHTQRELMDLTVAGDDAEGAAYLAAQLSAWHSILAQSMSGDDLVALKAAESEIRAGSSPVTETSARVAWVAVRPDDTAPDAMEADVAVVGGGAAGLAAAIAMARSRRRVVVIDAGEPRNAPADGIHNALGNEGVPPRELLAKGRAEAESYGVLIVHGAATRAHGTIDDFTVEVDGGSRRVHARRVILATGLKDDLPDVPGVREAWGRTVLHCPFCHGWEVRDQHIAILAPDEVALHQVMLFRQLSKTVTVFLHEAADPTPEQWAQLDALEVTVIRPRVERLVVDGTRVRSIEVDGGGSYDVDAVAVVPRFNARTELYEALGGEATVTPFGRQIAVDARGATAVPGVFAAGNAGDPMAMVVGSAASGVATGAAVHADLAFSDLDRAVRARRAVHERAVNERRAASAMA